MTRADIARAIVAVTLVGGVILAPASGTAAQTAQTKPAAEAVLPARVRVKLVVDKMEGTKVASSVPFELQVKVGGGQTTLNHGRSVPVPQMNAKDSTTAYSYQSVGGNIAIGDVAANDQVISFLLMLDISTVDPAPAASAATAAPVFRRYSTQSVVSVRPGETTQLAMSTDPITGDTVRLSVTADVVR